MKNTNSPTTPSNLKTLAGAYAIRVIESHIRDIAAASYPQPPQVTDPYYDYWVAHLDNIVQMLDGKSPQEIKKELESKK